jgi:hypothetical protein
MRAFVLSRVSQVCALSQTLNKWMKEEWCRIFDEQYVEDELIARLIRNIPVT